MPDIDAIIEEYLQAEESRDLARKEAVEQERQARIVNADAIGECIGRQIEPAFEKVKRQLLAKGFPCEVEILSRKDGRFPASGGVFFTGIRILAAKNKNARASVDYSTLHYEGKFEAQEMVRTEYICSSEKPADVSGPIALGAITGGSVDKDLELFLKKVFSL